MLLGKEEVGMCLSYYGGVGTTEASTCRSDITSTKRQRKPTDQLDFCAGSREVSQRGKQPSLQNIDEDCPRLCQLCLGLLPATANPRTRKRQAA